VKPTGTGRDIQLIGGLFLIVGTVDLVIIALFPAYALKLFGAAVSGPGSFLVKLHAPCRPSVDRLRVSLAATLGLGTRAGLCRVRCGQ
jgi:hypothetical protein